MTDIDFSLTMDSHIMDIDIHKNVTQLRVEGVNKVIDLVFSNNFLEKLSALIVLTRMQANTGFSKESNHEIDNKIKDLKKEIMKKYGKALLEGI